MEPVPTAMAGVLGLARGTPTLGMNEYIQLKVKGIAAPRIDRTAGPIFQSGVTSSLTSGQKNISRRRLADMIQDATAQRLVGFCKLPMSDQWKDGVTGEIVAYLQSLQDAKRITGYLVDRKSGNTPANEALGLFVVIQKVQQTPTADVIVVQSEVGESVNVTTA
jgi:hypothetical protein